jgi:hypothetical protein
VIDTWVLTLIMQNGLMTVGVMSEMRASEEAALVRAAEEGYAPLEDMVVAVLGLYSGRGGGWG